MDNLNKDNFWNPMREKYPDAIDHFCKWVDEYKKSVNWDKLFGATARPDYVHEAPKFHDLPIEFQFGIIGKWILEVQKVDVDKFYEHPIEGLKNTIAVLQSAILNERRDTKE